MLGLTQDQMLSALRWVLTTLGAILVSRGTIMAETWTQITGAVLAVAPFVWGLLAHTKAATVAAAAKLPEVDVIKVTDATLANKVNDTSGTVTM